MEKILGIAHVIYRYRIFYDIGGTDSIDELLAHEYIVKSLAHRSLNKKYDIGVFLEEKFNHGT